MKILGVSGIDGTVEFKRRHEPGLDEREYRISQGHDAAAGLLIDGELVAAVAEERIDRRKHSGAFPRGAIAACLAQARIEPAELDEVVHGFDYLPYRAFYGLDPVARELYRDVLSREAFAALVGSALPGVALDQIHHVDHHLAHAASAYYTSGWDECLVVVIDGMGEAHGASVYRGSGGKLEVIHRIPAFDSVGILYSIVTLHLGFDFNADEYKVMGLAPYGDRRRFREVFDAALRTRPDGGWEIPALRLGNDRRERENHTPTRRFLTEHLGPPRAVDGELTSVHQDIAAALQACLERALLHLVSHFCEALGFRRVALAGGVALNSTANARLLEAEFLDELYVQPAAADDGSALGAALQRAALAGEVINRRSPSPFYGPEQSDAALGAELRCFGEQIEVTPLRSLAATCERAAGLIADGAIVGWHRGRMEFGPRALGHRSILADPARPEMRERINAAVKMRERFRPFAPSVSCEQVSETFDVPTGTELPYMNVNVAVRAPHRRALPAITHVDGSARVQTVSASDNADFHALLRAVGKRTGRELVLNTSFNVKGQPIVNTATEAIETFLATDVDALLLGNNLVHKRADALTGRS